jgi:hypothetical protein
MRSTLALAHSYIGSKEVPTTGFGVALKGIGAP